MPETSSTIHKPFVIEIRQDRPRSGCHFIPAASLKLQEELRTSGLLHFLAPEDLKSLVYLLTFISPEGHCSVSLSILASAMKVPSPKVKARMHRLTEVKWQGDPLIIEVPHESGLFTYSLHPRLVAYEHLTVSEQHPTPPLNAAVPHTASKNRIVSYSRHHYARPRKEVERIIAQQMGHEGEETDEQSKLRTRLENAGLTGEQAKEVVLAHDADIIAQQLDWLPFRRAKNPAGYLLAAIEGGYGEPRGVREERLFRELRYDAIQSKGLPLELSAEEPDALEDSNLLEEKDEPQTVSGKNRQAIPSQTEATQNQIQLHESTSGDAPAGTDLVTLAADGEPIDLSPEL